MTNRFKLSSIAIALALGCQTTYAIADEQATKKHQGEVEKIVVTGTFSGKSVAKEEASFAISSFSVDDIKKLAPKSTADLFKAVPGIWAESSGGVSGANVFVRGFPGGGDAPFLTVQLQGAPIFPPPTLSFLENSTLFRLDATVEFMEALRGGPNPVLSNGQPGLTTNFLLKEGSEDSEGLIKYSTSDYGLQRIDGVFSGELADDLYFMVGGYIKSSPGVRDAGFNAEEGKQFTINLTKQLDNGKINFYTRQTDDHGVWYLPSPLQVNTVDNEYTQIGTKNRQATIQYGADNHSETFDFGKGRGWDGSVSGGSVDLSLPGNWQLVDRFIYTKGDADTYGLVPNGDAVTLTSVANNGSNAWGAVTGDEYSGDTLVQQIGRWVVKKQIEAFTNDFALTKTFDKGTFTAGFYHSTFEAKDWWALGNQAYHVIESGGEMLTGIDCNDNGTFVFNEDGSPSLDDNGEQEWFDGCGWNYDINSIGDGETQALYAALSYNVSKELTLDIGLRSENHQIEYTVDEGLNGKISKSVSYDETELAWTVGANWMFTKKQGLFARISNGSKMPFFDDFRDNYGAYQSGEDLIKEVTQYELGYKMASDNYELYATTFFNEVKGDTFVRQPGAPAEILTNEAYGIEIDFNYYNDNGFSVNLNSTIQETEITESPANQGNEAQRQPSWQVRVTPSYDLEFDDGMYATIYGTLSAVGDRYANNENTVTLDGYEKIDLGIIFNLTDEVQMQFAVNNLTDEDALTEGDPRDSLSSNGRYILPRTIDFSVSYQF
ncbi:TonB-dependent receptor [Thalassotalea insulae]|uniref:TonB-dependent receptor n=1 Tax=Thalassotalea insulae TaxID=2056778 RepID=A0ABQ6GLX3_9GAMM|nr:TonB-dependent receptor [Thalassotalea insulae]GLX76978.1 TonB-dependent receptor [Thalassotalea insulae]